MFFIFVFALYYSRIFSSGGFLSGEIRIQYLSSILSCLNNTEKILFGDIACTNLMVKSDYDSMYLILFAKFGIFGPLLMLLGSIFYCLGSKDLTSYIFVITFAIFLIVHAIDVSYTKPEFFIPFLSAKLALLLRKHEKENA